MSLFCRHNRFVADCPICSKGTVLEERPRATRRAATRAPRPTRPPAPPFSGPNVKAGPYDDSDGTRYEVRLEKVPGGLRLAEWAGSQLRRRAPVLEATDVAGLVAAADEVLANRDAVALADAVRVEPEAGSAGSVGISRGRSGDFKEELRVEALEDDRLRVARWVLRPGAGWQLQDAPPMLPAARFAEALAGAARAGLLALPPEATVEPEPSGTRSPARP